MTIPMRSGQSFTGPAPMTMLDQVMAAGGMPITFIRYVMTGLDDEVKQFWDYQPLDEKLAELAR